jgi:hypothetical protein
MLNFEKITKYLDIQNNAERELLAPFCSCPETFDSSINF